MASKDPLLTSIQSSKSLSERTRYEYTSSIRRAMDICKVTTLTQLLIKPGPNMAKLRAAYFKNNTLKAAVTAVVAAFNHNPAFADKHGRAMRLWQDHGRKVSQEALRASKNNVATDEEVKRMVPKQVLAEAAAKLGHTTESVSQDKVLLTIVAHAPAKRSDMGALRIVCDLSSTHGTGNYIVVPADSAKLTTLVLNRYKTDKYYGRHVELLPQIISDEVRKSIKLWPRKFLFSKKARPDKGAPLSNDAYRTRFHEVIHCHTGYNTGINLARHAYITEMANPMVCTVAETEQIAKEMMHSPAQ